MGCGGDDGGWGSSFHSPLSVPPNMLGGRVVPERGREREGRRGLSLKGKEWDGGRKERERR